MPVNLDIFFNGKEDLNANVFLNSNGLLSLYTLFVVSLIHCDSFIPYICVLCVKYTKLINHKTLRSKVLSDTFVRNCSLLPASIFPKDVFWINEFLLRHLVPCKIYQTHEDITAIVNVIPITREIIAVNFAATGLVTTVTAYASRSGRCAPVTYSIAMIVNTFAQNTIDSEFFYLNDGSITIFLIFILFLLARTLFWCNWLKV